MPGVDGDLAKLLTLADLTEATAATITCPIHIIHRTADIVGGPENARHDADRMGADLTVIEGGGHCPRNRDPVLVNHIVRDFVDRVHPPAPRQQTWTRALATEAGAVPVHPSGSVTRVATSPSPARYATNDPICRSTGWRSTRSPHCSRQAANACTRRPRLSCPSRRTSTTYDLVVADEAWDVDHFLHENPELKRFAYAWLTDFVGFVPMNDDEAWLTADYNAEMVEHIARFSRLRDKAIFVGDLDDVVPDGLGPGLPSIAQWTADHFEFAGYVTGFDPEDRAALRAELGYRPDETVCIVTVGGSGVGRDLLRRAVAAHPYAQAHIPSLRTIAVCGPRIDPATIDAPAGVEVRQFVPDLHRHLQACDIAVVQGGLTTCMELTAARRPFIYVPLENHFEQQRHVAHRLDRYRAGRRMAYSATTPETIADALVEELSRPVDYLAVGQDGAARAAKSIAELV